MLPALAADDAALSGVQKHVAAICGMQVPFVAIVDGGAEEEALASCGELDLKHLPLVAARNGENVCCGGFLHTLSPRC